MPSKRLYRSQNDRMLAGVCGGLGEYFDIDSIIFRLLFVLFTLGAGSGVLLYVIAWVIMPEEPGVHRAAKKTEESVEETFENRVEDMANTVEKAAQNISRAQNNATGGLILLVVGVLFLLQNITGFNAWDNLWPLILIAVGVGIILKGAERRKQ